MILEKLTSREQEILNLLLEGVSPKEIAHKLHISYHTVDSHRSNLYRKLGIQSIQELFAIKSAAALPPKGVIIPESDLGFCSFADRDYIWRKLYRGSFHKP